MRLRRWKHHFEQGLERHLLIRANHPDHEIAEPVFDLLRDEVPEAFVGDVACMLEVDDEVEDVPAAPPVVLVESLVIADLDKIKLDRVMEAIDGRVQPGDLPQKPAVVDLERFSQRRQHQRDRMAMRSVSRHASESATAGNADGDVSEI